MLEMSERSPLSVALCSDYQFGHLGKAERGPMLTDIPNNTWEVGAEISETHLLPLCRCWKHSGLGSGYIKEVLKVLLEYLRIEALFT